MVSVMLILPSSFPFFFYMLELFLLDDGSSPAWSSFYVRFLCFLFFLYVCEWMWVRTVRRRKTKKGERKKVGYPRFYVLDVTDGGKEEGRHRPHRFFFSVLRSVSEQHIEHRNDTSVTKSKGDRHGRPCQWKDSRAYICIQWEGEKEM